MTEREIQLRRTLGSGPPDDLVFGEAAFSDVDLVLYVGRANEDDPPAAFQSQLNVETTTQLNARDTANRARANHTGTQSAATISDFVQAVALVAPVQAVAGRTGAVVLAKADVGLGNVDNTPDAAKPISTATQAALDLKAPLIVSQGNTTYGATVNLNMATLAGTHQTISLTGNIAFTSSNRGTGRQVVIRLLCDSTQRTLSFPAGWRFLGTKPANIAASKVGVLSLTFFGDNDSDGVASWGVES
ncbi:hypothetical protein [Nodosilinea sp. FACHB-13]|uniref:hypothetical protein n=1 Tax=Cyanophyceae TaxID=3028117 RepID=UPI0016882E61|nr:hypothetical protein [Nodosilinea sp. FACHB-13]MBD2107424.1 hypothetical protein [Nodosilinea sp. FACHB-13]